MGEAQAVKKSGSVLTRRFVEISGFKPSAKEGAGGSEPIMRILSSLFHAAGSKGLKVGSLDTVGVAASLFFQPTIEDDDLVTRILPSKEATRSLVIASPGFLMPEECRNLEPSIALGLLNPTNGTILPVYLSTDSLLVKSGRGEINLDLSNACNPDSIGRAIDPVQNPGYL